MTPSYEDSRDVAVAALHRALTGIIAELAAYPTPIAGCDVQYTHLLAERGRLSRALAALEEEVFIPTPRTLFAGTGVESR